MELNLEANFDNFTFWFIRKPISDVFDVYMKEDRSPLYTILVEKTENEEINDFEILEDYVDKFPAKDLIIHDLNWYLKRPESSVGRVVKLDGIKASKAQEEYESLLIGLMKIRAWRAGKNPDKVYDYIDKVISWVKTTTFYEDPASTMFHESFKHGLLYHTLRVYNKMCELVQIPTFSNSSITLDSAALCCLVHDWCKIGLYESYMRNVKNEETGKWEQKQSYRRGTFPHPLGHGVASSYMAMQMFKLTESEFAAIRWHMSMFNVCQNEINEYQQSCEDFPLVHLIQFADQLSIVNY